MGAVTALPAVIAAEVLAGRPVPGVAPPEVALDPDDVFERLLQHVGATTTAELVSSEVSTGTRPCRDRRAVALGCASATAAASPAP
jgi:hypothetical protein